MRAVSRTLSRIPTVALWSTAIVVAAATSATATGMVNGGSIVNGSITSVDIKNGSVGWADISSGARNRLISNAISRIDSAPGSANSAAPGTAGTAGAAGANGSNGAPGKDGAPGISVVANVTTPEGDAAHYGQRVVTVERANVSGPVSSPSNASPGTVLVRLSLDKGTYRIDGAAQFLSMRGYEGSNTPEEDYGAVALFVDGKQHGSVLYSGDIPTNSNNLAQTNASTVVTITQDGTDVALRAAARNGYVAARDSDPRLAPLSWKAGDSLTWGGGNLIVSRVLSELK